MKYLSVSAVQIYIHIYSWCNIGRYYFPRVYSTLHRVQCALVNCRFCDMRCFCWWWLFLPLPLPFTTMCYTVYVLCIFCCCCCCCCHFFYHHNFPFPLPNSLPFSKTSWIHRVWRHCTHNAQPYTNTKAHFQRSLSICVLKAVPFSLTLSTFVLFHIYPHCQFCAAAVGFFLIVVYFCINLTIWTWNARKVYSSFLQDGGAWNLWTIPCSAISYT